MNSLDRTNVLALTIGPFERPARAMFDETSRLGIRCVQWSANHRGMRPRDLDGSARRDVLATLRRRGMDLSGIDLWIPISHFSDKEHASRVVESLLAALALAEDLGRIPLCTSLPGSESWQDIGPLVTAEANRRGICVVDHAADAFDREANIGIDPAAILAHQADPSEAVIQAGHRCKSARISDLQTSGVRGPLGQRDGQLDVSAYRTALAAIEYARPMVIDTRQWSQPWQGVRQTIATWDRAMPVLR